jgi:type IV secretion system protein VirD4
MPHNSKQLILSEHTYAWLLPSIVLVFTFLLTIVGSLLSTLVLVTTHNLQYFIPKVETISLLMIYALLLIGIVIAPKLLHNNRLITVNFNAAVMGCVVAIFGAFYTNIFYWVEVAKIKNDSTGFANSLALYLSQNYWIYLTLALLLMVICISKKLLYQNVNTNKVPISSLSANRFKFYYVALALTTPLLVVYPLQLINIHLFVSSQAAEFIELPLALTFLLNFIYAVISISVFTSAYFAHEKYKISVLWLKRLLEIIGLGLIVTICLQVFFAILPYKILSEHIGLSAWQVLVLSGVNIKSNAIKFIPLLVVVAAMVLFKQLIKKKQFNENTHTDQTSGNFGTASWATENDLQKLHAYSKDNGILIGEDNPQSWQHKHKQQKKQKINKTLYLPLKNKLTIAPPEGGKTSSSSIPLLLTYDGPVFVFDSKGELWVVTARYRSEVLKREVVVIDPFGITKSVDFAKGKPEPLLKEYHFNPFDWIPEDKKQRDRIINNFAASFVINEGGYATHFDENAKILIRGYIDYMMSLAPQQRNLAMLYHLMSEGVEEAQTTFEQMTQLTGRAGAAANQINRVGSDERGSILSTSYRQIDWMGDSNIQVTLSESNFDLRKFLKGNMDIFVVLPEDQVKEHNRLVRMMLALLLGMIVQAAPSELPKKKMLFLLEELAQLGYCPDVEQCIEVLRARGVVVWTVFQTLSQIELFKKPDLFKGAPLKQIFTNDDTKTMEWIQTLGGKKTVLTKTLSSNKGDSRQKMQVFGGSVSSGEGESIHETGVDLIRLNEIREMPRDEQFVFLHGTKPIRCKKVRYFEHSDFIGKFDANPLEK